MIAVSDNLMLLKQSSVFLGKIPGFSLDYFEKNLVMVQFKAVWLLEIVKYLLEIY